MARLGARELTCLRARIKYFMADDVLWWTIELYVCLDGANNNFLFNFSRKMIKIELKTIFFRARTPNLLFFELQTSFSPKKAQKISYLIR